MFPEEQDDLSPSVSLEGMARARLRVGEERPPCESPCPGCGSYFNALHALGCEDEQCPLCGGQSTTCGCG